MWTVSKKLAHYSYVMFYTSLMAHILLAEDDSAMRGFIEKTLIKAGHTVESCEDGSTAYSKITGSTPYDLLLTDIVMPGMDGIELSQKASDKHPQMKVMFITGFAAVAMDHKKADEGAKVLSKPFHLRQLVDQVNEILTA